MKKDKLNQHPDVVLLSAPYDFPPRQSLALSIFKACLTEDGMTTHTIYAMFRMAELLGLDVMSELSGFPAMCMYEEYLFSGLTGIKKEDNLEAYIEYLCGLNPLLNQERLRSLLRHGMEAASTLVEETAQEIASLSPTVLAVSSVFYQLNASLAIIKRVKELAPGTKTLMGGPNCMGKSGGTILRFFPYVDAVFFGEGDEVFPETIRALASDAPLPYGVLRREDIRKESNFGGGYPYRITHDLDKIPIPDFSDFQYYLEKSPLKLKSLYGIHLEKLILVEGSRGCWWGQKKPCTFCALNGEKNKYRIRSPKRIYEELVFQYEHFHVTQVEFTDNVLSLRTVRELAPLMENGHVRFHAFGEAKPDLTQNDILAIRRAGFEGLQIGLENLNDHLISLLGKGGSAAGNIYFLKICEYSGMDALWNFLYHIPGEEAVDYEMILSLLPYIFHLHPPVGYGEVLYERGSLYEICQERFGLQLVPKKSYRFLYGDNEEVINGFALYYDDVSAEEARIQSKTAHLHQKLIQCIKDWRREYNSSEGCHLVMTDRKDYLLMSDTRPIRKMTLCFLKEIARELCLFCDIPRSMGEITGAVGAVYSQEEIIKCLDYLIENRYMIFISEKYLTLAVMGET